ncbi:MAG TPA: hypothetical protein VME69_00325 [Methylocella sp.]|nr:hypothetical protein [Methylocella sp.]
MAEDFTGVVSMGVVSTALAAFMVGESTSAAFLATVVMKAALSVTAITIYYGYHRGYGGWGSGYYGGGDYGGDDGGAAAAAIMLGIVGVCSHSNEQGVCLPHPFGAPAAH